MNTKMYMNEVGHDLASVCCFYVQQMAVFKKSMFLPVTGVILYNNNITTRLYSTLCQNFKAIGEELLEILDFEQTKIYIFIYIDKINSE
jgi:hypothetical protein